MRVLFNQYVVTPFTTLHSLHMTSWLILSPRGMVFVAHGVGEYMGRYEKLGEILAENGILMFGHDHGGFGI